MQLKKSLLGLLVVAVALSLFTVYAGAFAPTETQTITSAYGSRFSTNPEDWFADGYNTTQPVYEMPDKNNTGHVTPKDKLVPFAEKYPDVPSKTSAGGITYTINAATAKKYNNVFEGFILEKGCFTVDLPEGDAVVFRDFYLDVGNALSTGFGAPRKLNIGRTIILDAELQGSTHALITGINTTLKRCYLHHCWADHIKGFAGQIIMSNYLTEGGLNGGNPHPDCIQFSVDDGHGKGLDTENVYIIGNRFDNMITDVNKTNCCIIIKSEFGGGIRNLQVRNNWFNGGGTCMQVFVNEKYPMKFYEGVVISDNLFGVGSTYNVDIMYGTDTDGVSLSKKVTATNNQKITKPVVSTIVYTSDGERVYDVADLTGAEKKVTAYVSNYVTSAVDVLVQAALVGPDGKVLKTTFTQGSLAKYLRPSDYQKLPNYKDYRYADEPMDIPVEVDISAFGDIPAGSNIVVRVYQEMQGKSLLYIRSDVMTTGGAYPIDAVISVPNGFVLVDADPNSPSSLFVKAVNSCKGLKGEDLYPFIIEALKLYDQTDDKIQGVTQAKLDLTQYISEYNAGIVRDNVLMQESIDTMQKSHPNAALHASLLLGLLLCIKRFIHL